MTSGISVNSRQAFTPSASSLSQFILFLANFLMYDTMNGALHIEEEITKAYPDQTPFYEDDQAWLKRKQEEENEGKG